MVCDARPVMRHPDKPHTYVVDPFMHLEDTCRNVAIPEPGEGDVCSVHLCCQITTRSYPCGCGKSVRFNLYVPAKTPCAYTVKTGEMPERGVWRLMEYLGGISSPDYARDQAAVGPGIPSEKLRIARSGLEHANVRLGLATKNIAISSYEKERDLENMLSRAGTRMTPPGETTVPMPERLRDSASFEQRAIARQEELDRLRETGRYLLADYQAWKQMVEKFEQAEYREAPVVAELAAADVEGEKKGEE